MVWPWALRSACSSDCLAPTFAGEEKSLWQRIHALGRPLLVGLVIMATLCGLLAYLLISLSWRLWAWRKRRRAQAAR
jgi:uncharacterized protein (DUF2062 family)